MGRSQLTTATVLIAARNEAAAIGAAVESAFIQTHRPEAVIVVDNGSDDDTQAVAKAAGATVLTCPTPGKAKAQNHALPHITTDVVVCMDADTELEPDCVELMISDITDGLDGTCAAVMPKQQHGLFVRSRRFEYALARQWWKRLQREVNFVYVLSGCACAFRTDAIRGVGGFSDAIISEDTDTTWQLHAAKYRLGYTRAALCRTSEPESWRVYHKQTQRWAAGSFQIIGRNLRLLRRPSAALVVLTNLWDLVFLPTTMLGWLLLGAAHPVTLVPVALWLLAHSVLTIALVSREIGIRSALACFPAAKVVSIPNRVIYLWALVREWVLGRHYASWTGRHGFDTEITPMSRHRRAVFTLGVSLLFGRPRHGRYRGARIPLLA